MFVRGVAGAKMLLRGAEICTFLAFWLALVGGRVVLKRSTDYSIKGYLTERICWWNEVCKEEFRSQFRCKCPDWSFCRAPGRYYNAFCSMTTTGYIWSQPGLREADGK